jgi:hypothetical protein
MNDATHPGAQFCEGLTIGGYTDWYWPAVNELEVCYYNLKPTTGSNDTSSGINPNAVPARASPYTAGNPAQTSVTVFQTGNSQALTNFLWSSTQGSLAYTAWVLWSSNGYFQDAQKNSGCGIRAVRRVPV